jgi:hypothetical protein
MPDDFGRHAHHITERLHHLNVRVGPRKKKYGGTHGCDLPRINDEVPSEMRACDEGCAMIEECKNDQR